ncbi:hypothetical protein [Guptibacillus algicola]|uniref:hypothetical protein n=1 Tax=Guptibacillus algicola TaxID=225844 RepID=UPI001CD6C52C|nr:hypothetical protein [Alkalihalobacillus algicola]MCA0988813.1 hypothetical protein [Alkalihalobacillus algicola]
MKNFNTLKLLDLFKVFFEKAGIDYRMMRRILQVKLTMDGRRTSTVMSQNMGSNKKSDQNQFLKSLWFYAFIGLTLVPILFVGDNYMFQVSVITGVFMFLIMTTMISDFSSVLLDVRDQTILGTRPVNSKTISASKAMHVTIYLFFITVAIISTSLIIGTIRHGILFGVLMVLTILFSDLFILAITAMLYYVILKFFGGERLRDMINYVQIGLSITIVLGYQVVARAFEFVELEAQFTPEWWTLLLPPVWFSAPFAVVLNGETGTYYFILSALAVIVPVLSFVAYAKILPRYEENLVKLMDQTTKRSKQKRFDLFKRIASLATRSKEEHAFYRFAEKMLKNERELKLKIYPSLGFAMIFPFVFLYNNYSAAGSFDVLGEGRSYLSIYAALMMIPGVVIMLQYSSKNKGAWIYHVTPVTDLTNSIKGTLKALLIRLFLPLFSVLSIIYTVIFGIRIVPDLLIVFLVTFIYSVLCFKLIKGTLPFSEPFESSTQSDGWKTLPFVLLIPIFGLIHLGATFIPFGVWIYLLLAIVMTPLIWKLGLKRSPSV